MVTGVHPEADHIRFKEGSAMTSDPLVGTWRLISWENRTADGRISYPVGTDPLGYLFYSEDGYMFVAIMRPNRTTFGAGDLLRGTSEEKVQAAETYVSYCGTYDFHGETVIHHVQLSLFPNWVGVDQERLVDVTANRLTLSTRPTLFDGIQQTARVVWERA
jgi:hypothetical protein